MIKTVTFCGHRELSPEEKSNLRERLYSEIERLIQNGAEEFLLGGYGDFDFLSARVVKELKGKYPHIRSVLVLAYLHQRYNKELYDSTQYPPLETVPKPFAILKRNQYMAEKSDVVISYVNVSFGGAIKTLEYAIRKKKINIMLGTKPMK